MKKINKLIAIMLTFVMMLVIITSTVVLADNDNGKGNGKDKNKGDAIVTVDGEEASDETGEDIGHGKNKNKEWKEIKKELEALKDKLEAKKDEIEASKNELEKQYKEALEAGNTELAEQLYHELQAAKEAFSNTKADMKSAREQMKAAVKGQYSQEELDKLKAVTDELENSDEDITVLPVESIILRGRETKFDTPPVIKDGRMLIPVRALSEAFGADVAWNGEERSVTITKGDIEIYLKLDSKTVYVNGVEIEIDVPAKNMHGRTVVPIRFIAENLGLSVEWDDDTDSVEIGDEDEATDEDEANEDEATNEDETTNDEETANDDEIVDDNSDIVDNVDDVVVDNNDGAASDSEVDATTGATESGEATTEQPADTELDNNTAQ